MELLILFGIGVAFLLWLQSQIKKAGARPRATAQTTYRSPERELRQGVPYAARQRIALDAPTPVLAAPAPPQDVSSVRQAPASAEAQETAEQTVMAHFNIVHRDGRYSHGGFGFSTLNQAVAYAKQRKSDPTAGPLGRAGPTAASVTPPRATSPDASPRVASSRSAASDPPRWISAGETAEIGGLTVSGGLFYAGKAFTDVWRDENCLIDTSLPVATWTADATGSELSYWPSYRGASPGVRRAYLEWLAGGRRDPQAGIGLVFMFFYGLERRLFVEKMFHDADAIVEEVQRLLAVYGENYSFANYARRLLDTAELMRTSEIVRPPLALPAAYNFEIPLPTRRYFGALLAQGRAFDADDALVWILSLPLGFRTPVTRCFDELCALWRVRFDERHPEGLKIRAPKQQLGGVYRSASGRFEATVAVGDLPDIAAVSAPLNRLRTLFDGCVEDLDAFSRLIGRKPEARSTLEGALCLPRDLHGTAMAGGVEAAREALSALIGDARVVPVRVQKIGEIVGMAFDEAKLSLPVQRQLGATLDRLHVAFEPDRRYGETALTPEGEMVIYAADAGAPVDPERPAYAAARTMVEIAALAAAADGEVVAAEFDQINADLQAMPELSALERHRLLARALHVLRAPPKQQAALARLAKLPESARRSVSAAAIGAVLADGHVQPAEVRFLEKLHKTLDLPQDEVYAALHRGAVQVDAPVVVAPEEWSAGVTIPAEGPRDATVVAFDAARLARIRQETSEVASLLAGIFADEEPPPTPAAPAPAMAASVFAGLEPRHAELLVAIVASGGLERSAFEARAQALKLLPDGALETINEWGFETFDEAVVEDDETLIPAAHLAADLRTMGNLT